MPHTPLTRRRPALPRRFAERADARLHAELTRFCQDGPNAGKPGVCPENKGDTATNKTAAASGKPASVSTRQRVIDAAIKSAGVAQATAATAREAAGKVGAAVWNKMPPAAQAALTRAYSVGKAVEHKVMAGFTKSRELARQAARERGLPDAHADRVAKILGTADLVLAWTVNAPAMGLATGSMTAAKVASWVPVASMGYLALSTAKNPLATIRAARKVFGGKGAAATAHAEQGVKDAGDVLAALAQAQDPDWLEALLYAALDKTHDLGAALNLAVQASKQPRPAGAAVTPHAEKFSEGGNALRGVEIFAAGSHRGKRYTPSDLDDMAANFRRVSTGQKPGFRVPLVIGHEETQEFLERSDLPAAGWASRVWRDGDKLKADFEDVPPKVARLLKGKAYRTVSSEVYDDPPEGVPGRGKMLRRVALLGGDIPQVKTLEEIPAPEPHSEGRRFARFARHSLRLSSIKAGKSAGIYFCFSEVIPMDREAMLKKLTDHGFSLDAIKDVPDNALAEMLRVCEDKDSQASDMDDDADDAGDKGGDDDDDAGAGDKGAKGDPFAEFADDELPEPKDDDEKKAFAEHARKYASRARKYLEKYCSMSRNDDATATDPENPYEHAEGDPVTTPTAQPKKTTVTHQFSEKQVAEIVRREVKAALEGGVKKTIDQLTRFSEEQVAAQKRQAVEAFCEAELKAGRLTAAEYTSAAAGGPEGAVFRRLMRADARVKVEKFRENGKTVELTDLEAQMREIRQRPTIFRERFGDARGKGGKTDDKADRKAWGEATYEKFSETFAQCGVSKEVFVETAVNSTADDYAALCKTWDDRAA